MLLIQVLEGKIDNVVVEGNNRYATEFLKSRFQYAVPAEGALYACFAVAADQHAKSDDVRTLREVTESFRVGRCANT